MRHVWAFVLFCLAIPVFARQDTLRAEVFGGYSYLHIDTQGVTGTSLDSLCNELLGIGSCPAGTFRVHNNFNGWNAAAQFNATRLFGIKADFGGNYGMPITLSSQAQVFLSQLGITGLPPKARSYNYLFGPVVFQSKGRYRPFAHALFGVNSLSTNLSNVNVRGFGIPGLTLSDTAFAMAFGGGLDVKLTDHISLRAGQADYLFTKHDFSGGISGIATHQNNFRASVGVVFLFGGQTARSISQGPHRVTSTEAMQIPALGVYVAPRADNAGARITEVASGGVASLAGLHPDDLIISVNGAQIKTPTELAAALSGAAPGSSVHLGYMIRGQWQSEMTVVIQGR